MKWVFNISFLFGFYGLYAQCTVSGLVDPPGIVICGSQVNLSAYGSSTGNIVFSNDFNTLVNQPGAGWSSTTSATYTNPCGVGDGTPYMWMGAASPDPRTLTTQAFDLSLGGSICFDLNFAEQGNASPCEGPDLPDEGVYLQFSTNGGGAWTTIHYFDPNGGHDPALTAWNQYCFTIPPGAQTASTMVRWFQNGTSGSAYDHWGIDNVQIYLNDPAYQIYWLHDGSTGSVNPNPVTVTGDTSFVVVFTDGVDSCQTTINVQSQDPVLTVSTANDTTICSGDCVDLNGVADVVINPGGIKDYCDNTAQDIISAGFGGSTTSEIEINVADLNMQTLPPGGLVSVCFSALLTSFSGGVDVLDIELVCPSGNSITLIPQGQTTGVFYTNTCISDGGGNIGSGSSPYMGTYAPAPPATMDDLVGCTANGIWKLRIVNNSLLAFGSFFNWCIQFDDPDWTEPAMYVWSPTTAMTGSGTLNPNVCPATTETYTLTANDSAGCTSQSAAITVTIDNSNCCPILANPVLGIPSCGMTDGSIDLYPSGGSGNYTYLWAGGGTTSNLNNLDTGAYPVTITDATLGCSIDTTIVLSNNCCSHSLTAVLDNDSCSTLSGVIDLSVAGGTGSGFTFVWSTNATTEDITGLGAGLYQVTVTDIGNGCAVDTAIQLGNNTTNCCVLNVSAVISSANCAAQDGGINVSVSGGWGNYTYNWSNGATTQDLNFVLPGNYYLTVMDGLCQMDTIFSVSSLGGPTISLQKGNESCAGYADGFAEVTANGGTAPLSYAWSNGALTSRAENLSAGTYGVTVADASGCVQVDQIIITAGNNCCNWSYTTNISDITCNQPAGMLEVIPSTNSNFIYILGTDTLKGSNVFTGLQEGTYTLTVYLSAGCQKDTTIVINSYLDLDLNIDYSPKNLSIYIQNLELNAPGVVDSVQWVLDGVPISKKKNFNLIDPFATPGEYQLCLQAYVDGCDFEDCQYLDVGGECIAMLPNAFTPNGDGLNDVFGPISACEIEFEFWIFNRWGDIIFYGTHKDPFWDGKRKNGKPVAQGVYSWKILIQRNGRGLKDRYGSVAVLPLGNK